MKMLLYINYTQNEEYIINEFINLNKSVSLPTLYTEENNEIKKGRDGRSFG